MTEIEQDNVDGVDAMNNPSLEPHQHGVRRLELTTIPNNTEQYNHHLWRLAGTRTEDGGYQQPLSYYIAKMQTLGQCLPPVVSYLQPASPQARVFL